MQGVGRCMEHSQGDPEDAPAWEERDSAREPRLRTPQGWCFTRGPGGRVATVPISGELQRTRCIPTMMETRARVHGVMELRVFRGLQSQGHHRSPWHRIFVALRCLGRSIERFARPHAGASVPHECCDGGPVCFGLLDHGEGNASPVGGVWLQVKEPTVHGCVFKPPVFSAWPVPASWQPTFSFFAPSICTDRSRLCLPWLRVQPVFAPTWSL